MRARPALLTAAIALALPAPAGAATVETSASTGPSNEAFVIYNASKGERNRVAVSITRERVVIVDRGAKRIRGGDTYFGKCRATGRQRVVCEPLDLEVELGDGNDSITFAPGTDSKPPDRGSGIPFTIDLNTYDEGEILTPAVVLGGSGDDNIAGTRFDDYILPGPGRDVVDARGGDDAIESPADGAADRLRGGGGADWISFYGSTPVTVDLGAGSARAGGVRDSLAGFETVIGSRGDDTIRGSDLGEAIYGDAGTDRLDGRGGSDALIGGERIGRAPTPDVLVGGAGDDYLDATGTDSAVPSSLDCGPGSDTTFTQTDDRVEPSCELVAQDYVDPDYRPRVVDRVAAFPGGRTAEGNPIYTYHCSGNAKRVCEGRIELSSPPGSEPVSYGEGTFGGRGGDTLGVTVVLNDAGRAAVAGGMPVAVRAVQAATPSPTSFGWQEVLPN